MFMHLDLTVSLECVPVVVGPLRAPDSADRQQTSCPG